MIWGYDLEIFQRTQYKVPIRHDIATHCHLLLTGASGTGKSYALLFLLGMLLKEHPQTVIFFCDFKNSSDFSFLQNYAHYYSGKNCYDGIMKFYDSFSEAREKGLSSNYLLICDEYPALINYLQMQDKVNKTKFATDILSAVSEILMTGRGIGYASWLITQRADNTLFLNGSRDNFMVIIGLGRLSKEQKGMLFSGEEVPDTIYTCGEGIILSDGSALREVKYPKLLNLNQWKAKILSIIAKNGVA
jgi:hypothetical protein